MPQLWQEALACIPPLESMPFRCYKHSTEEWRIQEHNLFPKSEILRKGLQLAKLANQ